MNTPPPADRPDALLELRDALQEDGASAAFTQRVVDRFLARRRWRRSIRSAAILLAGIGIALLLTRPSDPEGTPPPPGQQLARLEAEYVTLAAELRQLTALTEQTHLRVWLASGEAFDITLDPRDLAPAVGGAVPAALPTREPGGLPRVVQSKEEDFR